MIAKLFARKDVSLTWKWKKFVAQVRQQLLKTDDDDDEVDGTKHDDEWGWWIKRTLLLSSDGESSPEKEEKFVLGCYRKKDSWFLKKSISMKRNHLNEYFYLLGSLQATHQILKAASTSAATASEWTSAVSELEELFQILLEAEEKNKDIFATRSLACKLRIKWITRIVLQWMPKTV